MILIEMIMNKLTELFAYIWKTFLIVFAKIWKIFFLILMLFEEVRTLLIAVMVLILLDQFTGVYRALYFHIFKWRVFNRFYAKLILYLAVIMGTFVFEEFIITLDSHYFTKGIATVIGFQELASAYLNVTEITGKQYLMDFINYMKKKLL